MGRSIPIDTISIVEVIKHHLAASRPVTKIIREGDMSKPKIIGNLKVSSSWRVLAFAAASGAGLALASTAAAAAAATTPAGASDTVTEVVVTAQKRAENVQDVPSAIQAITGAQIEQQGATSLQDLERTAPSVSFGDGSVFGRAGVRGVVDYSRNAGYDARVGVYIDGVFMGRSFMNNVSLLDVDHIEVLRGPQGTLFGKNNDAGAVNIVTRAPSGEATGEILGETGNFGYHNLSAYVSGPLSGDVLDGSIAVAKADSTGDYYNPILHKNVNGINHLSERAQLRYRPNDDWDIRFSVDGQDYRDSTVHNPQAPAPGASPFVYNSPTDDSEGHTNYGGTLTVQRQLPAGYSLINIMDYRTATERAYFNGQGNQDLWLIGDYHDKVNQFSEELRLTSPKTEKYDYVAGLYFFRMDDQQDNKIDGGQGLVALGGPFAQYAGAQLPSLAHVVSNSFAAYFNGDYRITDQLEINGGVRLTEDHKTLDYSMLDPFGVILGFVSGLKDARTFTNVLAEARRHLSRLQGDDGLCDLFPGLQERRLERRFRHQHPDRRRHPGESREGAERRNRAQVGLLGRARPAECDRLLRALHQLPGLPARTAHGGDPDRAADLADQRRHGDLQGDRGGRRGLARCAG